MKHDDFDRYLDEAAKGYNRPPEPPREAMWSVIRESVPPERREAGDDLAPRRSRRERVRRLRRFTPWAVGLATAATLAVGFGLGRVTREAPEPPMGIAAADSDSPSGAVRFASAEYLGEAEALLTLYRSSQREGDRAATVSWARELLTTTRMMLDSRAGADPRMAQLLGDLELVLVQIVNAGLEPGAERELIEEGIEQRQILAKLRSASVGPIDMAM